MSLALLQFVMIVLAAVLALLLAGIVRAIVRGRQPGPSWQLVPLLPTITGFLRQLDANRMDIRLRKAGSTAAPAEAPARRLRRLDAPSPAVLATRGDALGIGTYRDVERKLEEAFALLERGRISLPTYASILDIERRGVALTIEQLRQARSAGRLGDAIWREREQEALDTLEAIAWCQRWAASHGKAEAARTAGEAAFAA